jgi:hypothetical protein
MSYAPVGLQLHDSDGNSKDESGFMAGKQSPLYSKPPVPVLHDCITLTPCPLQLLNEYQQVGCIDEETDARFDASPVGDQAGSGRRNNGIHPSS